MVKDLKVPKPDKFDSYHALIKGILGSVPQIGPLTVEVFTNIFPSSIEKRREKWMELVVKTIEELIKKDKSFVDSLNEESEFFSLFIEATQIALKTHRKEKLEFLNAILVNSVEFDSEFFSKSYFLRLIDQLDPNQILILDFIIEYSDRMKEVDSYEKLYNILTNGAGEVSPVLNAEIDIHTVVSYLNDLSQKQLIIISDSINQYENIVRRSISIIENGFDNPEFPYINISTFGKRFLKMIYIME